MNFRKNISDIWHFGFFYFYRGMFMMGKRLNLWIMRSVIIAKYHCIFGVHVMISIIKTEQTIFIVNMVKNAQERTINKPDFCLDICCILACTNSLKIGEDYQTIVFYYFFYFIKMFIYHLINPSRFFLMHAHSFIPSISAFHSKKSSSSPIFPS